VGGAASKKPLCSASKLLFCLPNTIVWISSKEQSQFQMSLLRSKDSIGGT
jgi:hypothetical protein